MIMYNVTVSIDPDAEREWLAWIKEVHLPDVLATGHFAEAKIARILAEEEGGKAYSIQYFAESMEAYQTYEREDAERLRAEHRKKFGTKTAAFRTLLHVIHHNDGKG